MFFTCNLWIASVQPSGDESILTGVSVIVEDDEKPDKIVGMGASLTTLQCFFPVFWGWPIRYRTMQRNMVETGLVALGGC